MAATQGQPHFLQVQTCRQFQAGLLQAAHASSALIAATAPRNRQLLLRHVQRVAATMAGTQ
eukprot:10519258-Alexandrium_andersonii.AAC.1